MVGLSYMRQHSIIVLNALRPFYGSEKNNHWMNSSVTFGLISKTRKMVSQHSISLLPAEMLTCVSS